MKQSKREKELTKIIGDARAEMESIETERAEKESKPLVGRFFKSRNNYSCPEKPSDYWFMYRRVTGADGVRLTTIDFYKDQYGRCVIEHGYTFTHLLVDSQHTSEIKPHEFQEAWRKFQQQVVNLGL